MRENQELAVGKRQLVRGNWQEAVGKSSWQKAVGSWLEA